MRATGDKAGLADEKLSTNSTQTTIIHYRFLVAIADSAFDLINYSITSEILSS